MKVEAAGLKKANDDLKAFLRRADGADPVRVVLILDAGEEARRPPAEGGELRPADYSSVADYRKALIDRRKSALSGPLGETVEALRSLSLQLTGGEIGRAIVAEGAAAAIAAALRLSGVSSAMLDRSIELGLPRQDSDDGA